MKKRKYSSPYLARDYFSKDILPNMVYAGRKVIRQNIPYRHHDEIDFILVRSGEATVTVNSKSFPISRGSLLCLTPSHFHKIELSKGSKLEISECHLNSGVSFYLFACPYYLSEGEVIHTPPTFARLDEPRTLQVTKLLDDLSASCEKTPIGENQNAFFLLMKLFGILETYAAQNESCLPTEDTSPHK